MKLTIFTSDVAGAKDNCIYPHRHEVSDAATLAKVVRKDHVCAAYRNNYRGNENFITSDCIVMDVDNDDTEDPECWITPQALEREYADIGYAITYSRHHMKQKEQYGPRPRFHIYFQTGRIDSHEAYGALKKAVQEMYPFFDKGALDAGRFVFGCDPGDVAWHDGPNTIESLLEDDITPLIAEGSRNQTMYRWAVRRLKREGNTEESEQAFYREAERCTPPLSDTELRTIWKSAAGFYEKKVVTDPSYRSPQEYKTGIPDNWEEPIPFGKYELEPFPIDALPEDIAQHAAAVAENTQTPVDMAGTASLAFLAVCIQGKYVIEGKPGWEEPTNLFANIIASPSERKSAVLHAIVRPGDEFEKVYNREHAAAVEGNRMRRRILERQQRAVEDKVSKGKAEPGEVEEIARQIAEFEEVKPLQLYVDDITTEKLVSVMAGNRGRAALVSSEGGIFDTLAGIYTRNVNIDVMLKGYSGDTIRVDRVGRESECIMDPTLTILLMTQPKVVADVLGNPTFRGRGLTARFLYCLPTSSVGERRFRSRPVPDEVYHRYERKVVDLLREEYPPKPETITLSPEASDMLASFAEEIEPKMKKEYAEIADWVGKLVGNTLRIAGILCRAEMYRPDFLRQEDALEVGAETMGKAIQLGRYYLSHALAVYDVVPETVMYRQADKILKMIREKGVAGFSRRDAMRNCRSFKKAEEIQPVLDFLEDCGYIASVESQVVNRKGRPPLPKYVVNPAVLS